MLSLLTTVLMRLFFWPGIVLESVGFAFFSSETYLQDDLTNYVFIR